MNRKLAIGLVSLLLAGSGSLWGAETRSLRAAAAGLFELGVGIIDRIPDRTNDWPLLLAQFGAVTPENCMKPVAVQSEPGQFNFAQADAFVEFATRHRLKVVGHCLVWAKDDRTPPWFYRDGERLRAGRCCWSECAITSLQWSAAIGAALQRGMS